MRRLHTPLRPEHISSLQAGDHILLSGSVYTARDQAHKKLVSLIKKKKRLPIELENAVIYYCGPTPEPDGKIIGSCGPTTASRMDSFSPVLLAAGHRVMIGKGERSEAVRAAVRKYRGLYCVAYGGCGAYLQQHVINKEDIAFKELGPEAIYRLEVKDFPLIIGIDSRGMCLQ